MSEEAIGIQFNIDQALAKLGELVERHGPDAVNLAAEVVRVGAIQQLVSGCVLLASAAVATGVAVKAVKKLPGEIEAWGAHHSLMQAHLYPLLYGDGKPTPRPDAPKGLGPFFVAPIAALSTLFAVITGANAIGTLTNVWMWVALAKPELALAREVWMRVTGQ